VARRRGEPSRMTIVMIAVFGLLAFQDLLDWANRRTR
jgi:hypothetical protein